MKNFLKYTTRSILALTVVLCMITALFTLAPRSHVARVFAQATGYRFAGNSLVFTGQGGGIQFENVFNGGADIGLMHLGTGQLGPVNGGININPDAVLNPPPQIALATATTGGTIPAATYRAVLIYVTPTLGMTNVAAAGEATQATTGTTSTITATAPVAQAGAAGYIVAVSPGGGATLTETLQPMTTAVCAGAFQVNSPYSASGTTQFTPTNGNPPAAPATPGITVCPFGVNAVLTSLVTGPAIPLQNSAAYPMAFPHMICNLIPQTAITTVTTIQTMGSCILGPGIQNVTGKVMKITGHLTYTSSSQTGTMTISALEDSVTPIAVTSAAIVTGGQTTQQAQFDYYLTTSLTGTSGTLEPHGVLCINAATGTSTTTAELCSGDGNTAASSTIDLTASHTLKLAATMTTSTTSITLKDAQVWLLN